MQYKWQILQKMVPKYWNFHEDNFVNVSFLFYFLILLDILSKMDV